jgi:BASS family bile acid:Na+ symporter
MKTFLLLLSITAGVLFPYGQEYTFLIRYFLMVLLFFAFLDVKFDKEIITARHFVILFTIIAAALALYFAVNKFDEHAAQAVFITAIGPTAIAATVVISLKKGKVEFVIFSVLLNNIVITLLIPFLLPLIISKSSGVSFADILMPVIITLTIPFVLAKLVKYAAPKIWSFLVDWKDSSFYLLIINIYIATSDASDYIRNESPDKYGSLILIGLLVGILCLLLFSLGWIIGGKKYAAESSQSLGQKNNSFTIWIASTYMNPVAVIGPVFYVLFQNIYVSWELFLHNRNLKMEKEIAND